MAAKPETNVQDGVQTSVGVRLLDNQGEPDIFEKTFFEMTSPAAFVATEPVILSRNKMFF